MKIEDLIISLERGAKNFTALLSQYLDIKGNTINDKDHFGKTLLMHVTDSGDYVEIVHLLLQYRADLNEKENMGMTALMFAARSHHKGVLLLLLQEETILVDVKDNNGVTALMHAVSVFPEEVESAKLLISAKADVNATNDVGKTPLMFAADAAHLVIVIFLITQGVFIDMQDKRKKTALSFALSWPSHAPVLIQYLIEQGSEPDLLDPSLYATPLNLNEYHIQMKNRVKKISLKLAEIEGLPDVIYVTIRDYLYRDSEWCSIFDEAFIEARRPPPILIRGPSSQIYNNSKSSLPLVSVNPPSTFSKKGRFKNCLQM